ncbi:MAG: serine/threonine protein kinase [Sandaracinaceae bacterium]|nr:serine/threonine protein kinase [Sandaracinaceae bacterium]
MKPGFPVEKTPVPEEADPWLGRTLSNVYVIEEKIGEGGMGSVYVARHVHLEKQFAVKVLVESVAGKNHAVERLKQEAMAAANIDHENIVDVVNFDRTPEGAVFIVMEFLKGESLSDTLGRGPLELRYALPITYQICRALHAAHEHGIVHRDLKPENVFLTERRGRTVVKVLDFGISKVKKAEAEQVRMTKTGQLVGTPLYMSPEQARGESDVDRRVDIYAMGVMLYEMITGAPPFEGRNYFELLWKHGNELPPSMHETNPNVFIPPGLDEVVLKALAKDPADRFQTMAELEAALIAVAPDVEDELGTLAQVLASVVKVERGTSIEPSDALARAPTEHVAARPAPAARRAASTDVTPPRRSPWPIAALGLGAVLAGGAVIYALTTGPSEAPTTPVAGEPAPRPAPPEPPPEVAIAAAEPPAEPPRGVEPPARVSVHLTSSPSGARVRLGDRELGTTPLVTALDVSDEAVTLTYELDEHLAQTITLVPVEGVAVPEVRLRRRRRGGSSGGTGGELLPIKTGM